MGKLNLKSERASGLFRGLALGLIVLTMLCLIWPTMIGVRWSKIDYDNVDNLTDRYSIGKSQAKAYIAADYAVDHTPTGRYQYTFLDLRNLLSGMSTKISVSEKADKKLSTDLQVSDIVSVTMKDKTFSDYDTRQKVYDREEDKEYKSQKGMVGAFAVFTNMLFFGMLAVGVAALVLTALNRGRIMNYVLAILSLLCMLVVIILLAYMNGKYNKSISYLKESDPTSYSENKNHFTAGIGMFLMPIFAIAACFLYNPEKKGAPRARRMPKPAPSYEPAPAEWNAAPRPVRPARPVSTGWEEPAPRTAAPENDGWAENPRPPRPAAATWAEPANEAAPAEPARAVRLERPSAVTWSGSAKKARAASVEPQQPQASTGFWFCRTCGTQNPDGVNFCPNCGTKRS